MENQETSSKSIMLKYGALLGFISVLINVVVYALGKTYDQSWVVGVISILVMITIIVLGIKKFKESNEGFLKLGEALKIGLGTALIGGIIIVIYNFIFTSYIEPDYFSNMIQIQEQLWIEAEMTEDQIENAKGMMEMMSGIAISSAVAIILSLFFGFIISLIGGLIMKKSNEEITSI